MSKQQTNQDQFLDDSVEYPNLPDEEPDEEISGEDTPDNVTVNGGANTNQMLGEQADIDIELQEEQSKGVSQAYNQNIIRSYKVDGVIYQEVTYSGAVDGKFYKTASGKDISEEEFYKNAPTEVRNKYNGGQITKYQFEEGNQYYKTAEVGGKPTRTEVNSSEWATASKYNVKSYTDGAGNGNATIYTPDGLQRTTISKVRTAMVMIGNYKKNGTIERITINGITYNSKELYEAGKNSPLPNGDIFRYDGD